MSTTKELRRAVASHARDAERALSAVGTYRDNHYARTTELARVSSALRDIKRLVDSHVCRVEFGSTEDV